MQNEDKIINRYLLFGWTAINLVLFVAYTMEFLKGIRSIEYVSIFLLITFLPEILVFLLYRENPESEKLKYYIVVGFFIMYTFVMITGHTTLVFTYIFPMLSLLVLYHRKNLILAMGIASLILNLVFIGIWTYSGDVNLTNSRDFEIQIALIILCFGGSYMASHLYGNIDNRNKKYVKKLDEDSYLMQEMSLQSIATIANTIDAKDPYTKGHSQRVAEYSHAIALALGMSKEEANEIRHVALLHDIGKISIPDSILNKPGRLTDEEFEIMKTHPAAGAEILKDVTLVQGLDVGAKYHHERYDGKGYPSGLKGEEIPYVARIICVADSFDAMSSNRVYRNRMSMDDILNELERCKGTQFDPHIADVFIDLLRTRKIIPLTAA